MSRRSNRALIAFVTLATVSACTVQRMQPSTAMASMDPNDHLAHMSAADLHGPMVAEGPIDMNMQGHEGLPASNQTAAARLKASPRHGEWVKIAWEPGSKDSLMAWVVYPKSGGKAPVVVVVHEIFGLSTWVQGVADQVAAEGFVAIAPDLISRVRGGPSSITLSDDSARKLIGGVDAAERNRGIMAAANYAMMQPSATQKYGVIGYCWGGQTVFMHAINGGVKGFSGGVAFYGLPFMNAGMAATATMAAMPGGVNTDSLAKIKAPVMLLSGTKDARIGAAMPGLDSAMKKLGKNYVGTNYEGAIHGFLRAQDDVIPPPTGRNGAPPPPPRADAELQAEQAANLAATKDGWPKTVAFLKKNLK